MGDNDYKKYAMFCPGYGHDSTLLGYSSLPPDEQAEVWCGECTELKEWVDALYVEEEVYQDSEDYRTAFYGPSYPTLRQTIYLIVLAQFSTIVILTILFLSFYSPS